MSQVTDNYQTAAPVPPRARDHAPELDRLMVVAYHELRQIAHRRMQGERSGHTLQTTAVELRYFGGLGVAETGEVLGLSPATVKRKWALAQAWLYRELHPGV